MNNLEVNNRVIQSIVKVCKENEVGLQNEIATDKPLIEYGIDSVVLIELIIVLENEFDLEIDDHELVGDTFKCVDSIVEFISSREK